MFTAGQALKFQYSNSEMFYPTTMMSNRQAIDDPESVHLWGTAFLLNKRPVLVPKIATANDRYISGSRRASGQNLKTKSAHPDKQVLQRLAQHPPQRK